MADIKNVDLEAIDDEEELHKLISDVEDVEQRKKIRDRMKVIREKKAGSDVTVKLDQTKAKELNEKHFGAPGGGETTTQTKTETADDGSTVTTTVTTTKKVTKDGASSTTTQTQQVTQTGSLGTTTYNIKKSSAEDTAQQLVEAMKSKSLPGTCGVISVRAESWNSRDGTTDNSEKTEIWGGVSASSSSEASTEKPGVTPGGGGSAAIQRSPSAIKELLLNWCKMCTKEYDNVEIKNFSGSWNNGMAFCALIHHFRPVFDYKKLNPKCRRGNFKLAFDVAEKFAGIAPLLDVDDMVRMKNPDWKCVFTYVQSFYRKFRDEEGGGPPPPKPKPADESES